MNATFKTTLAIVKDKAEQMTREEIQAEIDYLLAEANSLCKKIIHNPSMQDTRDRVIAATIGDYTMLATAWSMV